MVLRLLTIETSLILLGGYFIEAGYQEVIIPAIWEASTFQKKIANETLGQMWTFTDKGGRECCLIPEVTGIIQEMYNNNWSKELSKPIKIFYESKAYRYERPQAGRYREFTQFGLEILGTIDDKLADECKLMLLKCLATTKIDFNFVPKVTRGLGYYIEDGFEVECAALGAQKQVAGGGKYAEGIGWAIGVDRVLLAQQE